jgi:hypothetical protein
VDGHIIQPRDTDGNILPDEYEWLRCDLNKALVEVWHSATNSRYVAIKRSKTGNLPSQLVLEFSDLGEAVQMISWVPGNLTNEDTK